MQRESKNISTPIVSSSVQYALEMAAASGRELPPGDLVHLERLEWNNRYFLLDQAKRFGPIFKVVSGGKLCVCIVGLQDSASFLQAHRSDITPQTISLESLFPKGFIRQMSSQDHIFYRRALVQAVNSTTAGMNNGIMEAIITDHLTRYAKLQVNGGNPREIFIKTLNAITSGILIQLFFGIRYGSKSFEEIMAYFEKLGPNGVVWEITEQQKEAFVEICEHLQAELLNADNTDDRLSQSILGVIKKQNVLDESFLGNLIYMVEIGRYDSYSLLRWISKFAADNPALVDDIAVEDNVSSNHSNSLAHAFVMETLRLEQSERLMRCVNRDIIFRDYLIPKHSLVRLCLWESHKSEQSFANPFAFNPYRFMEKDFTSEQFAPFGLDEHRCPLANISLTMSAVFLRTLAKKYKLEPISNDVPIRGFYHWEPSWDFAVKLHLRGNN